ncbi:MAG: HEAT repeat domain-containing protein [Planctomycetota bacterium]
MTFFQFPEVSNRREVAEVLFQLLENPDTPDRHRQEAMHVFRSVADPCDRPRLERFLLDRSEKTCVRRYASYAIDERDLELSDNAFQQLRDEIANAEPLRRPQTLAEEIEEFRYPKKAPPFGKRDLAWRTIDRESSRRILFEDDPRKLTNLRYRTRHWSRLQFEQLRQEHPELFRKALDKFYFPPSVTLQHLGEREVWNRVPPRLSQQQDTSDLFHTYTAIEALAQVDGGLARIDQLRKCSSIGDEQRRLCERVLLRLDPQTDVDSLERCVVKLEWDLVVHDRLTPKLIEWALEEIAMAEGYLNVLLHERPEVLDDTTLRSLTRRGHRLTRIAAWGALAHRGETEALTELIRTAKDADHVVLRGRALQALRDHPAAPPDVFVSAIRHDTEIYGDDYQVALWGAAGGLGYGRRVTQAVGLRELCGAQIRRTTIETSFTGFLSSWIERRPSGCRYPWNPLTYRYYDIDASE